MSYIMVQKPAIIMRKSAMRKRVPVTVGSCSFVSSVASGDAEPVAGSGAPDFWGAPGAGICGAMSDGKRGAGGSGGFGIDNWKVTVWRR